MISGKTQIFGIFGHPVEHTFSPGMHNAAFKQLKLNACYVPFPVHPDNLETAVKSVVPLRLCGLNITVPHKEKVIPFLDELSREAALIGAVNTVEIREGRLIGHNTDGRGFLRSLKEQARFNPRGKTFLCLGSGGAARAIGFSLALANASRIFFFDPDSPKASMLARDISAKTGADVQSITAEDRAACAAESDCVINATPLGLRKNDPLPLDGRLIASRHLVCDLVYNPAVTPFLRMAKTRKAKTLQGLGMLLFQGVIAFEIWTGKKAPVDVMKRALYRQIRS